MARIQVNDSINATAGQTLIDTADFTPYYVNRAWLMLQQELLALGWPRFLFEGYVISGIPGVSSLDTALQASLSWEGYSDGVITDATRVLPQNLIKPLKLMERPSGQAPNIGNFIDMDGPEQGIVRIPPIQKQQWNGIWVWNSDSSGNQAIFMPGALVNTDLRIDYEGYIPDFTGSGMGFPGSQTANILRCEDAFAGFIAFVFCDPRGDVDASTIQANAMRATKILAGVTPDDPAMAGGQ